MQVLVFASLFSIGLAQIAPIVVLNRQRQNPLVAPDIQVQGQVQTPLGTANVNGEAEILNPQLTGDATLIRPAGSQPQIVRPVQVQGQGNVGPTNGQVNGQISPNEINAQGNVQPLPPSMNGQLPQIQPTESAPVSVRQFDFQQGFRPSGPVISGQPRQNALSCGFSCSRQSTLLMNLDREFSSAACSAGGSIDRCNNCCQAIAIANGIEKTWASGFMSTNGRDCICCINRQRC